MTAFYDWVGDLARSDQRWSVYLETRPNGRRVAGRLHFVHDQERLATAWIFLEASEADIAAMPSRKSRASQYRRGTTTWYWPSTKPQQFPRRAAASPSRKGSTCSSEPAGSPGRAESGAPPAAGRGDWTAPRAASTMPTTSTTGMTAFKGRTQCACRFVRRHAAAATAAASRN